MNGEEGVRCGCQSTPEGEFQSAPVGPEGDSTIPTVEVLELAGQIVVVGMDDALEGREVGVVPYFVLNRSDGLMWLDWALTMRGGVAEAMTRLCYICKPVQWPDRERRQFTTHSSQGTRQTSDVAAEVVCEKRESERDTNQRKIYG